MPTFDFSNVIAKLVRMSLRAVRSPLGIFTVFATGLGSLASYVVSTLDLPSYVFRSLPATIFPDLDSNTIVDTILFVANVDSFLEVFELLTRFLFIFIPFIITALTTLFALKMAFSSSSLFRQTLKDLTY